MPKLIALLGQMEAPLILTAPIVGAISAGHQELGPGERQVSEVRVSQCSSMGT